MPTPVTSTGVITVPSNPTFISGLSSPDGLTIDPWGNLIVAHGNGISCYSPTYKSGGSPLFAYTGSGGVTNVELGGSNGRTLFYTRYSPNMGLYSIPLNQIVVPEPASLALLGVGSLLLLSSRRRRRLSSPGRLRQVP